MDDRKGKDTKSRLYEKGQEKLRKLNNEEQRKKIEGEVHAMQKQSSLVGEAKDGHRGGMPTGNALYNLHLDRLRKQESIRSKETQDRMELSKTTYKNKESEMLRIQNFKKEFRIRLTEVMESDIEALPKE